MNEQLQAALSKVIEQMSEGAANAAIQLPDAFKEYVMYQRESSISMMLVFGGMAIALLVFKLLYSIFGRASDDGIGWFFTIIGVIICVTVIAFNYNVYISTKYPLSMALEMARSLLRN